MKHFDHEHRTVAEVRACDARRSEASARLLKQHTSSAIMANLTGMEYRPITPQAAQRQDRKFARMNRTARPAVAVHEAREVPAFAARPAHPNRVQFAAKLISERNTDSLDVELSEIMMNVLDEKAISADEIGRLIDALLPLPRPGTAPARSNDGIRELAAPLPDKGYYALCTDEDADEVHFYRITRNERGYLTVQEQASDTLYDVHWKQVRPIIAAIVEDIDGAAWLYAEKLERCYRCGRTLTDATSRELGIGPDCRSK